VFTPADAWPRLTMDCIRPEADGPFPAAVLIRSGLPTGFALSLAMSGFAVFLIDPRESPETGWRGAVAHIHRAIRFIRYYAPRWGADRKRIALIGASTGGYAVNLAAMTSGNRDSSAKDPADRKPHAIQAAVVFHAYADLRRQIVGPDLRALLARDIDRAGEARAFEEASPALRIRGDAPPFLLIHGDRDESVPLSQSVHWQLALQNRGIRADLIIVEGGAHGLGSWRNVPGVRPWEEEMLGWLAGALGPGKRR
jgi:dipeptidyl aminopeptidase/acylaminoacyl peptidase